MIGRLRQIAPFIGLDRLAKHLREMPLRGHLANLSAALMIGFFAVALKICSYQPGDLADTSVQTPGGVPSANYRDWADAAGIDLSTGDGEYRAVEGNGTGLAAARNDAEAAVAAAQFYRGGAYLFGRGVAADLVEAYRWTYLSARNVVAGHPYRTALGRLQAQLTEGQLDDAVRMLRAWEAAHPDL